MSSLQTEIPPGASPSGFWRRVGAMFYDALLLLALHIMLSFPYVWLTSGGQPSATAKIIYQSYLLAVCILYYTGFWVRGGQTLGLRTWRLKLVRRDGGPVTWKPALIRFAAALLSLLCLGLGFFWILFDRDKLAWHDRLSGTRIIWLPPTV